MGMTFDPRCKCPDFGSGVRHNESISACLSKFELLLADESGRPVGGCCGHCCHRWCTHCWRFDSRESHQNDARSIGENRFCPERTTFCARSVGRGDFDALRKGDHHRSGDRHARRVTSNIQIESPVGGFEDSKFCLRDKPRPTPPVAALRGPS